MIAIILCNTFEMEKRYKFSLSSLTWLRFVQLKGPAISQEEIITKLLKYIDKFLKSSSPEQLGKFQQNLAQSILG